MSRVSTRGCVTNCSMARCSYTLREAQVVIKSWRRHYNRVRPHASLGYRAPAPEVVVPALATRPTGQPRGSIKPCQVFIGADVEQELTFGLDHFVGADQKRLEGTHGLGDLSTGLKSFFIGLRRGLVPVPSILEGFNLGNYIL